MRDLIPGVSRNTWRMNDPRATAADLEYKAKRPNVLSRGQHTCSYCGVRSPDAMEVHHQDCDHGNNADINLALGCVFCHPVHHLGEVAQRFTRADQSEIAGGHVRLSYLPGISQADLSHLLRTIGHVLVNGTENEKMEAEEVYDQLLGYALYIEGGWGSSDAAHFAVAFREAKQEVYEARAEVLTGVRVIFTLDAVKRLGARFSTEFEALRIASWDSIYAQRKPKI